jgi:hypothetical protein
LFLSSYSPRRSPSAHRSTTACGAYVTFGSVLADGALADRLGEPLA